MNPLFISSNGFPKKNLDDIFALCDVHDIRCLELGSGVAFDPDADKKIIARGKRTRILLHNYIPAPEKPFVVNLASTDAHILERSKEMVRHALAMSAEIHAPFYAVHSGFAYEAEIEFLGKKQTHLPRIPLREAEKIFTDAIFELSEVAKRCQVQLLVENNVVTPYNTIHGENLGYCIAGIDDSIALLRVFSEWGVGLLLDTGHMQVTAQTLGFSRDAYIEKCQPYIRGFQCSDNNGIEDEHLPIPAGHWTIALAKKFPNIPVTLEVNNHLSETLASLHFFAV